MDGWSDNSCFLWFFRSISVKNRQQKSNAVEYFLRCLPPWNEPSEWPKEKKTWNSIEHLFANYLDMRIKLYNSIGCISKILFSTSSQNYSPWSLASRPLVKESEHSYTLSAAQNSISIRWKLPDWVVSNLNETAAFPEFQNKRTISYREFLFRLTFLPEFPTFWVEWFKFSNFQILSESRIKLCSVKQNFSLVANKN